MAAHICFTVACILSLVSLINIRRVSGNLADDRKCTLQLTNVVSNMTGLVHFNLFNSGCTKDTKGALLLSKITRKNSTRDVQEMCVVYIPFKESVNTKNLCECNKVKNDDPKNLTCTFSVKELDRDENAQWKLWSGGHATMTDVYITLSSGISNISTTIASNGGTARERTEDTSFASQRYRVSLPTTTSFPATEEATADQKALDKSESGISLAMVPFGVSMMAANGFIVIVIIVIIVVIRKRGRRAVISLPPQHNTAQVSPPVVQGSDLYEEILEDLVPNPPRCARNRRDLRSIVAKLQAIQPPARCENCQPDTYLNPSASTPTDPNPGDYEPVGAANVNVSTTTSPSTSVSTQSQNLQPQDTRPEDDAYLNPVASTSAEESNNPRSSNRSRKTKYSSGPGISKELDDLDDGDDAYLNPVAKPSVAESELVGRSRNRKTNHSSVFKLTPGMAKNTVDHDEVDKSAHPSSAEVEGSNQAGSSQRRKTEDSSISQPGMVKKNVDQDEGDGSLRPASTVNRESQETAGHKEAARKLNSATLPMFNKTRQCATSDGTALRNFSPPACDANANPKSSSGGPVDEDGYLTAVDVTPRNVRAHSFTLD
ncbi:hypothetical protein V1264_017302 [Littorina saxatilis]|uniref:Uncharacterized protein n=1 Tax=Littorina saxatilis TaxID=31220 RepID=A0AAN9GGK8_9CAEN